MFSYYRKDRAERRITRILLQITHMHTHTHARTHTPPHTHISFFCLARSLTWSSSGDSDAEVPGLRRPAANMMRGGMGSTRNICRPVYRTPVYRTPRASACVSISLSPHTHRERQAERQADRQTHTHTHTYRHSGAAFCCPRKGFWVSGFGFEA